MPEGFKRPRRAEAGQGDDRGLVELLEHPNGWHRDTASRLLYQTAAALRRADQGARLEEMVGKARRRRAAFTRCTRWRRWRPDSDKLLAVALTDPDPRVREHALRLCRAADPNAKRKLTAVDVWKLRSDPDPNVRIQLAHSLRLHRTVTHGPGRRTLYNEAAVFVQLALKDLADPWMRLAVLAGMKSEHHGPVVRDLAASAVLSRAAGRPGLHPGRGRAGGRRRERADTGRTLVEIVKRPDVRQRGILPPDPVAGPGRRCA